MHGPGDLDLEVNATAEALEPAWDALCDRLAAPPFMRPGWILAWSSAFGHARISALTASRAGQLVGLVPFIKRRAVVTAPTNWHTPLFGFLADGAPARVALAERFLALGGVRADLSFVDREDPNLAACMTAAERYHRRVIVRTVLRSPYVPLGGIDWSSYRASLGRKVSEVERRKRRLQERGTVVFEVHDGRRNLSSLLAEGFELEASGWKQQRGSAIVTDPQARRFYAEVARWASQQGRLVMAFVRLNGRGIAFSLCLQCRDALYVVKLGFDPEFRRFGPGMLLTYESLRRAIDQGLSSYEFLGREDAYKLIWTDAIRERVRFQAFSRSPGGRASHLAWSHGRSAVRRAQAAARR